MGVKTPIQWSDDTTNPTAGCDGCELWNGTTKICYAGTQFRRFKNRNGYGATFNNVTMFPGRMEHAAKASDLTGQRRPDKPWLDGWPRLIFVSDMSDALSKAVKFEYLETEIINVVAGEYGSRHIWQWLTKRPGRMAKFSAWLARKGVSWPENLWAGTSITKQETLYRIRDLLDVGNDHTIRFLSVEPQLRPIEYGDSLHGIDWVIHGGQSKQSDKKLAVFEVEWAESLLDDCRDLEIPFFLKQLGASPLRKGVALKLKDAHGGDWDEWPAGLRVREVPRVGWIDPARCQKNILQKVLGAAKRA